MTATHVLFVAWESADEKSAQAQTWANVGNKSKSKDGARKFKAIVYKKNKKNEDLKRMQTGQIYILGHGAAGYDRIADIDGDARVELSAGEVADRLVASGLNPDFMGSFKCFSCDSAKAARGELAFADVFAYEMRRREYIHCRYFGYTMPLESAYADHQIYEDEANKGVFIQHKHALYDVNGIYVPAERALDHREEF